jgi:hypothetical protein
LTPTEMGWSSLLTSEPTTSLSRPTVPQVKSINLFSTVSLKRISLNSALRVPLSTMVMTVVFSIRTSLSIVQTDATTTRKATFLPYLTPMKMEFSAALNSQTLSETETLMATSYCHPKNSYSWWEKTRISYVRILKRLSTMSSVRWPNSAFRPSMNMSDITNEQNSYIN